MTLGSMKNWWAMLHTVRKPGLQGRVREVSMLERSYYDTGKPILALFLGRMQRTLYFPDNKQPASEGTALVEAQQCPS